MKRGLSLFVKLNSLLVMAALLIFASAANAQTAKPIKHRVFDKKFIFVTALSIGVSVATTATISRCRHHHGIGPCMDGGYGEYKQREALRQGLTGFLIFPSYKIKQIEDDSAAKRKWWWTLQVANTAANAAIIGVNAHRHYGPRDRD